MQSECRQLGMNDDVRVQRAIAISTLLTFLLSFRQYVDYKAQFLAMRKIYQNAGTARNATLMQR